MSLILDYLSRKDITGNGKAFLMYIMSTLVIFVGMFFNRSHALDYCNIFVIIQASAFFLMFKNLNIKKYDLINTLAKSVWGIFVIHGSLLNIFSKFDNVEQLTSDSLTTLVGHFLVCVVAVFVSSLVLDKIFSFTLKPIHYVLDRIGFANKSISIE